MFFDQPEITGAGPPKHSPDRSDSKKRKRNRKRIVFYSAIRRGLFAALSTCSSSRSASADAKSVGEIIGIQCLPPPVPSAPNR